MRRKSIADGAAALARMFLHLHNSREPFESKGKTVTGKVITVAQQKGGAGKTTLAVHLAAALRAQKKSVVLIDTDPQGSLVYWSRQRGDGAAAAALPVHEVKGWRAKAEIESLKRRYDIVVVDSPPHAETEAKVVVRAADLVVIPVQPSPMDLWATEPTLALAANEGAKALLVLNRVPPRANLTLEMIVALKALDVPLAKSRIGNRVIFATAMLEGATALERQRRGRGAAEIGDLAKEVLRALK